MGWVPGERLTCFLSQDARKGAAQLSQDGPHKGSFLRTHGTELVVQFLLDLQTILKDL